MSCTKKKFIKKKHNIFKDKYIKSIDNHKAYGALYDVPVMEIDSFNFMINNKKIKIAPSIYKSFYGIYKGRREVESLELYSSCNGDFFFLYINAGVAADNYFAKLVFDDNKFLTEIVASYYELVLWKRFNNPNFLGF